MRTGSISLHLEFSMALAVLLTLKPCSSNDAMAVRSLPGPAHGAPELLSVSTDPCATAAEPVLTLHMTLTNLEHHRGVAVQAS